MAFKINKVKADLRSYPQYIIMGLRKTGKTTLFRDLVLLNYQVPEKGLLISCGTENGYKALDNLQVVDAKKWSSIPVDEEDNGGFVQIVDSLIEMRGTPDQVEMVGIDTLDQLVAIAIKQVEEEHRNIYGKFPKSMNDALGGYGAGPRRVVALIEEQIERLNMAGMAVFIIAHTKVKEMTSAFSEEKYEMITNSLDSRYYNPLGDTAQMVVNIVIDREINGASKKKQKTKDGKEIEIDIAGRVTSSERYMYFRDDTFVDAGGRFEGLPDRLPLSAENFMKAFELGVENSRKTKLTKAEVKEALTKEEEENTLAGKKLFETEQKAKKVELARQIREKLNENASNKELLTTVAKAIKDNNIGGLDEESLSVVEVHILEEILTLFK